MISRDVKEAANRLSNGELVAIPTETVYGLAGSVHSSSAIRNIFATKKRPHSNPLIVHIHSIEQLNSIVKTIPESALKLAKTFWPGPLTLVLEKQDDVSDLITAGKPTVAVRMPNHPMTLELLRNLEHPIVAPSANPFNRISPTTAQHVDNYFSEDGLFVLDGGPCNAGIESTIVGFETEGPIVYRLGSLSLEKIETVIGKVRLNNKATSAPTAPGMLSKHYSPVTKTILVENVSQYIEENDPKNYGVLCFSGCDKINEAKHVEVLSLKSDMEEAASNLYNALHALDNKNLDCILIEKVPNHGLGVSINDRLERAASSEH